MASKATHASLWLPGFEIDAPAYPDLFSSNDEAAVPAADLSADSGESATADTAGDLPRPWRPATAQATQPTADNPAITWPQWTDSVLGGLEGQATKFNANIEAIAALRDSVSRRDAPAKTKRAAKPKAEPMPRKGTGKAKAAGGQQDMFAAEPTPAKKAAPRRPSSGAAKPTRKRT